LVTERHKDSKAQSYTKFFLSTIEIFLSVPSSLRVFVAMISLSDTEVATEKVGEVDTRENALVRSHIRWSNTIIPE